MEHPTFVPAVSQGSLGKIFFFPLPEKQAQQPHGKPCPQLQRGANEGALEGCSYISFGARSASESCPFLLKRTLVTQGALRTQNASFPVLVALALLWLCSSPIHHPSSPLLHHPALTPGKLPGPTWPCLACFTAQHPRAPQKQAFPSVFRPYPCRRTAVLGTDPKALQWLGWPQLGQPVRRGETGRNMGLTCSPFPLHLIWSVTTKFLPPVGHRA